MISIEDPGRFSRVSDKQNNINGHTILSLRFYVSIYNSIFKYKYMHL